ncbi:MAG: 4-alpha-glucanotransferase [Verrucomicrobiota bacterium]
MSRFQGSGLIDYQAQMQARRNVLELLARGLFARPSARRDAFELFLRQRPELARYAAFRAATEKANCCWQNWPERQRGGELSEDDYAPAARDYHAFVQWLAQEQMEQLVAGMRARQVDLYLDLPLGVHPDGYDVWREQHLFALAASVGAPPDPFFSRGQNWGFPPLHPAGLRRDRYRSLLEYLRFQMRQTGLLRIDHVMGLHRLYWVPKGLPPDQGAYVTYPAEELYALLSLESHRHRTVLVGENLGTVPPAVNSSMDRHRLRRMSVVPFEQQPDPARALRVPPRRVVASLNTHDMPTFAAHWRGRDISDRHKLGLIAKNQVRAEQDQRRKLNAALAEFLRRQGHLHGPATLPAVWRACLRWLSATPSEIVLLNLEDAWGEEQPQNTPGTFRERPNWRRKLSRSVEEITSDQALADFLRELRRIRSGKTPTRPSRRASGLSA